MERIEALQRNGGDITINRLAVILAELYVDLNVRMRGHGSKLKKLTELVNTKLEKDGNAISDIVNRLNCQGSLIRELKDQSLLLEGVALGVRLDLLLFLCSG